MRLVVRIPFLSRVRGVVAVKRATVKGAPFLLARVAAQGVDGGPSTVADGCRATGAQQHPAGVAGVAGLLAGMLFLGPALSGCGVADAPVPADGPGSPYLLTFAGDKDLHDPDFVAVIDVDPASESFGAPVSTLPIGHGASMPHHTEYVAPPPGEPLFMNAHHHELSLRVDIADPLDLKLLGAFSPPGDLRFPHDYTRTPTGTRLVGFLRSNGESPDPAETTTPAAHGGVAEYSVEGELLRATSAAVDGLGKAMRPYAFALLPEIDRFVVTSAPMMERSWADVIQIYRYSDFTLLHTLALEPGDAGEGPIAGSQAAGFGPRVLPDGTVFLNSYGCTFYHLTDIETEAPSLTPVYALKTPPPRNANRIRGACGIPVISGKYWLQPVGEMHAVVVLDISDPTAPREVSRIRTNTDFLPHWLAKDPLTNRFALGAEVGDEKGFFMLRFDEEKGRLSFDRDFNGRDGSGPFARRRAGYISFDRTDWPHGETGPAWGHAAIFLQSAVD